MSYDPFAFEAEQKNYWNYSKPEQEGYSPQLSGTVIEMEVKVRRAYQTNEPMFFDNGNPKLAIDMTILDAAGIEWHWTFQQNPKTNAFQAVAGAAKQAGCTSLRGLLGKMVSVATQEPPKGFGYGQNSPRPWAFQVTGDGDASKVRGIVENKDELENLRKHPVQAVAQQGDPRVMQAAMAAMQASMQGNATAIPQQVPMQPQPVMQQMPMPQPAPATQPQPAQQQVPASVYANDGLCDEDIPF